ncbi:Histone acetyltransferase, partial [Coemansia aciculifera]
MGGSRPGTPSSNSGHGGGSVNGGGGPKAEATTVTYVAGTAMLTIGCKAFFEKDGEIRQAEILSIRDKAKRQNIQRTADDAPLDTSNGAIEYEFYVHYVEFNKRLDEWVVDSRARLDKPVTVPKKKNKATMVTSQQSARDKRRKTNIGGSVASGSVPQTPEAIRHDDAVYTAPVETFSKEKEIEKLRTQGSMTQSTSE